MNRADVASCGVVNDCGPGPEAIPTLVDDGCRGPDTLATPVEDPGLGPCLATGLASDRRRGPTSSQARLTELLDDRAFERLVLPSH